MLSAVVSAIDQAFYYNRLSDRSKTETGMRCVEPQYKVPIPLLQLM